MKPTASLETPLGMEISQDLETKLHLENEAQYPEIAPHTYRHCQKFVFGAREPAPNGDVVDDQWLSRHQLSYTGLKLRDILLGAHAGCRFFLMLFTEHTRYDRSVQKLEANVHDLDANTSQNCLISHLWSRAYRRRYETLHFGSLQDSTPVALEDEMICSRFPSGPKVGQLWVWGIPNAYREQLQYVILAAFELYRGGAIPPNLAPGTRLSIIRAAKWLETCERTHALCRARAQFYRPRKLLEIHHDAKKLRLVTNSQVSWYACLSYCWDGEQPTKTTMVRLDEYSISISITDLPATIQDAAKVAYDLGITHLWVDAICIVQDNRSDVSEQLAEMNKIFHGAAVTIVASSAATSSTGFLQLRTDFQPTVLRTIEYSGQAGEILVTPHIPDSAIEPVPERRGYFRNCGCHHVS